MTAHDADAGALSEHYRDLIELDRRPEGIRYSATLLEPGTPVVVLAISQDLAARISSPERFLAASERASRIHYESLSRPLQWGRASDGVLHVAYARPERPLAPGSLSAADVATVGVQIARSLAGAHEAGVIHGAIATERISQTRDRVAQLGDFGLFAALAEGGLGVKGAATALSEPAYVSPEAQVGDDVDERSDIYSLGASLYELLTGKPPYGGRTTSFVMATVLSDPDAQTEAVDELGSAVVEALLRAIERAPDDRWPSAAAFANALAAGVGRDSGSATAQASRARGCFPGAVVGIASVLLAIGVIGTIVR